MTIDRQDQLKILHDEREMLQSELEIFWRQFSDAKANGNKELTDEIWKRIQPLNAKADRLEQEIQKVEKNKNGNNH